MMIQMMMMMMMMMMPMMMMDDEGDTATSQSDPLQVNLTPLTNQSDASQVFLMLLKRTSQSDPSNKCV